MAKKVKIDFTELTDDDIREKLAEESLHLKKMKFNHAVSSIENPLKIRESRRNVARYRTEQRKRELAKTSK